MTDTNCASTTALNSLRRTCNGLNTCSVRVWPDSLGGEDPCGGTTKYLQATYKCVGELNNASCVLYMHSPLRLRCCPHYSWIFTSHHRTWYRLCVLLHISDPPKEALVCGVDTFTASCPTGQVIEIIKGEYGRHDTTTCPHTGTCEF